MSGKSEYWKLRKRLGLNQQQFWNPVGVTQSGGSRYESGRVIPKPVKMLLDARYRNKPIKRYIDPLAARYQGVPVREYRG